MSKGLGFSISDIQSARKSLNHDERSESKNVPKSIIDDKESANEIETLKELYRKNNGNLSQIFEELKCNPRKALKHPPKDENEFANKFYQGYYTMVQEDNISEGKTYK